MSFMYNVPIIQKTNLKPKRYLLNTRTYTTHPGSTEHIKNCYHGALKKSDLKIIKTSGRASFF